MIIIYEILFQYYDFHSIRYVNEENNYLKFKIYTSNTTIKCKNIFIYIIFFLNY